MNFEIINQIERLTTNKTVDKETKLIAKYLLKNLSEINSTSITLIASKCNTSPTKVTRFAEKLGLKGFSELKLRLADLSDSIIIDGTLVNVSKTIPKNTLDFLNEYSIIHQKSFEHQFEYLKTINMDKLINLINKSKKIYLFAFNLSYNVSKNFVQRLRWYGIDIISESDYVSIETYLNRISHDDLVILITISGVNRFIEQLGQKLTKKTNLIGIGDSSCKFKNLFDDYLQFETNESSLWNINSVKAQLTMQLLDFIYVSWISKHSLEEK